MSTQAEKRRSMYFVSILYPESATPGWEDILTDLGIPALVSPLHDKDMTAMGEPKKPHYHVILLFDSLKSMQQAQEVFDLIGAVQGQKVASLRGKARYLCHLDDANKAQYKIEDVMSFSGADYLEVISLPSDKYRMISEIIEWCCENGVSNYADLLDYARLYQYDWFRILCDSGTYVVKEYLKSHGYRIERAYMKKQEGTTQPDSSLD